MQKPPTVKSNRTESKSNSIESSAGESPFEVLWVYNPVRQPLHDKLSNRSTEDLVNVRAWAAWDIDLHRIHFVKSAQPIRELKPVFYEDLFQIIILQNPEHMRPEHFAFLQKRSQRSKQCFFIIRPFLLSSRNGNPYARFRFNAFFDFKRQAYRFVVVKPAFLKGAAVFNNGCIK